ncbi:MULTISPECIES: TonB family protein [unclassified Sphingopyxis]|uniref:TonB family protein n=1 Tax=unclassified Sphingopyxis TaxID=2614943 RepID=UPI003FA74D40
MRRLRTIFSLAVLTSIFPPIGVAAQDTASAVISDAYPPAALRIDAEGRAYFEAFVTSDGKPQNCRITQSSGNADLDAATCNVIMTRTTIKPPLDEAG